MNERKYKRLSFEDRMVIQDMVENHRSVREIANTVGVHASTIYNELRRCPHSQYDAMNAQRAVR